MDFVDQRGLREPIRAAVSPETRGLIDKPPRPMGFIPSRPIDEVEAALQQIAGAEACVECGRARARRLASSLFRTVQHMIVHALEPRTGGKVTATFQGPDTPEAALHALRGSLQFVFEASGTTGTVGAPEVVEVTPQRTVVRYLIRWP